MDTIKTELSLIAQLAKAIYNKKTEKCDIDKLDDIIKKGVNVNDEYKDTTMIDRLIFHGDCLSESDVKIIFDKLVKAGIDVVKSKEAENSFAYAFDWSKDDYMMSLLYEASPEIYKKYICEGDVYKALRGKCEGNCDKKINFLLAHGFEMNFEYDNNYFNTNNYELCIEYQTKKSKSLKEENQKLLERVNELEIYIDETIGYLPGGKQYNEIKERFEKMQQ